MLAVLSWWAIMEVLGLLALPLTLRLLRHLPDRGYAFAKPLGLLLCGYFFWIGGSLGFLSNTRSAIVFAMLLLGALSAFFWSKERTDLLAYLRENWRLIVVVELVFLIAFAGWAVVRAYNPDIAATEKPMEIAFLNAILRSERFPPHDPWLSGFAISYYYFGYLLMAMLTRLSGVAASVAFNLAIALLFALTAAGSFGLVYDLLATDMGQRVKRGVSALMWSLLGPIFVLLIGNLEGLFEVLHTRGLGSPGFWKWLDVNGLVEAPTNGRWIPSDTWWWWRASRVVNDRDLAGNHAEVIDEFPQFSFLLGDMHPHVLNLPFVLLACALALNVLLGAGEWLADSGGEHKLPGWAGALARWPWLARALGLFERLGREHAPELLLMALCLGAMGFLNAWDLPIYLLVVVGAFFLGQRAQQHEDWLWGTLAFGAAVAVPAALLYLPFYLGFQSQAGGVLPELFNSTKLHQYLLMFGLFVFVIASWVLVRVWSAFSSAPVEERNGFWRHFALDAGNWLLWVVAACVAFPVAVVGSIMLTARGRQFVQSLLADPRAQALIGTGGVAGLLRQTLMTRLSNPWLFLLLAVLLALLLYLAQRSWEKPAQAQQPAEMASLFVYWIAGVAFLLTLAVEFVYLRDLFGSRMNTVFKFYYQAWVLMAIAAAFGAYYILGRKPETAPESPRAGGVRVTKTLWAAAFVLLLAAGMLYPLLGIPNKAGDFRGKATLDGMAFVKNVRADDYAAMHWLQDNERGMAYIVEATGGSYSDAAWVSAFTGLPTILGWDFHEDQWRGNDIEPSKRRPDIAQIYQSSDSQQVLTLLQKYDIKYVYVGPTEKRIYELPPNFSERLSRILEKVFEQGGVAIYRR